jgi:hypothetical protein
MLAEDPAIPGPSMVCAWLVANADVPAPSSLAGFPIFWALLPAVVIILIAAAIVAAVKRWRDRPVPEGLTVSEQLSQFRTLYEEGELSAEEFAQIRTRLGAQLKQELEIPPGPGTGSTPPPPPTPDPDPNIRPGPPGTP